MKLIFCMQINIRVSYKLISTLWASSFLQGDTIIIDDDDQAFSKYLNKITISLQYLKKEVTEGVAFLFYCDAKHSDILRESSHVRRYLFSLNFSQACLKLFG